MQISTPELIRERSDAYRRQMESVNPRTSTYTMACPVWPGMAKLVEESGEVGQICGKIMAVFGSTTYYDGTDLKAELEKELADLQAAITFLITEKSLDVAAIENRKQEKLLKYYHWKARNE